MGKKSTCKEDMQTLAELNSAHCHLQVKCQLVQSSCIKWIKNCSCPRHIISILLTELGGSVWGNLDLSWVYWPHCIQSVLRTSGKILPYNRPPTRLIRAKQLAQASSCTVVHWNWILVIISKTCKIGMVGSWRENICPPMACKQEAGSRGGNACWKVWWACIQALCIR